MKLRVKELIKEKGETVTGIAKKMGITYSTLYRHLNGNPSLETLKRIADTLDVRIVDLFDTPDSIVNGIILFKGKAYKINGYSSLKKLINIIEKEGIND